MTRPDDSGSLLALGIDAGGTRTRWALVCMPERIVAQGHVGGLSALQLGKGERARLRETLADLAAAVLVHGHPASAHAGLSGFGEDSGPIRELIAQPLGIAPEAVTLGSDIETACLDLFAPGEGYVVHAGTGSVAAFIDAEGNLHRAGGRGVTLDDGGGGFWIAREALRHIWRAEDECPGSWQDSPMAREVFQLVGGSDWSHSRRFVYGSDRGDIGRLALAVAKAADADPVAAGILRAAGRELARLANAMTSRHGPRPIALAGRAVELHPLIGQAMREALPAGTELRICASHGHHAAARLALKAACTRRAGSPPDDLHGNPR
ncbi:MAG: ATPase [Betaproteobacteria bacterium]|nr:ATPase [Betaproteobacteria bacterium]